MSLTSYRAAPPRVNRSFCFAKASTECIQGSYLSAAGGFLTKRHREPYPEHYNNYPQSICCFNGVFNAKNRPVLDGYVDFDYVFRSLVNGALLMQSVLIVLKIYSYQRQVAFSSKGTES